MDRIFTLLVTMVVAFGAGLAWDRRPPISYTVPIPIWRPKIELPDGLQVQRDKALASGAADKRRADQCSSNLGVLDTALKGQNAAIDVLGRDTARRAADLARQLERAAGAITKAQTRAAAMDFAPQGATECERMLDVDRHVVESRR